MFLMRILEDNDFYILNTRTKIFKYLLAKIYSHNTETSNKSKSLYLKIFLRLMQLEKPLNSIPR